MAKSHFAILGVTAHASPEEIRSAYRRLAKVYHPDHYPGGSEPFRQVQEAYAVLGNPNRRQVYQTACPRKAHPRKVPASAPAPEPLIPTRDPVDLGEVSPIRSFHAFTPSYEEVFDWLWSNFSSLHRPKSARLQDLTLEVPLTREQAARGGTAKVMVPARALCPACRGLGSIGLYECLRCAGEGAISGEMPVSIAFPGGLVRDHAVVIPLQRFGIENLQLAVVFLPRDSESL